MNQLFVSLVDHLCPIVSRRGSLRGSRSAVVLRGCRGERAEKKDGLKVVFPAQKSSLCAADLQASADLAFEPVQGRGCREALSASLQI